MKHDTSKLFAHRKERYLGAEKIFWNSGYGKERDIVRGQFAFTQSGRQAVCCDGLSLLSSRQMTSTPVPAGKLRCQPQASLEGDGKIQRYQELHVISGFSVHFSIVNLEKSLSQQSIQSSWIPNSETGDLPLQTPTSRSR